MELFARPAPLAAKKRADFFHGHLVQNMGPELAPASLYPVFSNWPRLGLINAHVSKSACFLWSLMVIMIFWPNSLYFLNITTKLNRKNQAKNAQK